MDCPHRFVRIVMKCFGAYLCFNIVTIMKKEMVLEKARVIKSILCSMKAAGEIRWGVCAIRREEEDTRIN